MVHGAATPSVDTFDLRFQNYSWMAFLAEAGFDVFAMDFTGYGFSPRPMMDEPGNADPRDQRFLIPNPLPEPCAPSYPFTLTNMQSDWDEMDTVVEYVRQLRGVERVSLVGWSRAGVRIGGYTARHPEKVEKLFLYAPRYNRLDPSDPPKVLPEPGVPMRVQPVDNFAAWDAEVKCEDQFTPAIREGEDVEQAGIRSAGQHLGNRRRAAMARTSGHTMGVESNSRTSDRSPDTHNRGRSRPYDRCHSRSKPLRRSSDR